MVKPGDLIQLAYTPDLTAAGIAYVGQQLQYPSGRRPRYSQQTLRQQVVDKAVELAFRRYLDGQGVPYTTVPGTSFGSHASFYLVLGGWRCTIRSSWIDDPGVAHQVNAYPECLLDAAALLPSERIVAWIPGEKDLYIFVFVTANTQKVGSCTDLHDLSNDSKRKLNSSLAWLEARLHGNAIYLAGYCTHPDYSRRSRRLARRSRTFPTTPDRTLTRILYVRELHPIRELLEQSKTTAG